MRPLGRLMGLVAFGKGVLLLLDPEGSIRLARQFAWLLPSPARHGWDRVATCVVAYARRAPGGLTTAGLLLTGSGLLVLLKTLRSPTRHTQA